MTFLLLPVDHSANLKMGIADVHQLVAAQLFCPANHSFEPV
jgi:hypothetical protein